MKSRFECTCECHRNDDIKHVVQCCQLDLDPEWFSHVSVAPVTPPTGEIFEFKKYEPKSTLAEDLEWCKQLLDANPDTIFELFPDLLLMRDTYNLKSLKVKSLYLQDGVVHAHVVAEPIKPVEYIYVPVTLKNSCPEFEVTVDQKAEMYDFDQGVLRLDIDIPVNWPKGTDE